MGRARGKLTIKHIQDDRARKLAFNQRNNNLAKKVSDFSRKFGVEACLIVYDGYGDGRPMTTPQDSTIVRSMLEKYEQQKIEGTSTTTKIFDVKDYFANKIKKAEAEISKVHKEIVMKMYPTWHPCFMNMGGEQLKTFIGILDGKIQACNKRISMLNKMQQSDETSFLDSIPQRQYISNHVDVQQSETSFTQNSADPLNYPVSLPHVLSTGTNQFGEVVKLDDEMAEPIEWTGQLGEHEELNNFVGKPVQEWLAKLDGIGEMDFTNHVDVQQRETSFTQNTAHTQRMAKDPSNSNQFEGMHDGFYQWQPIYDPLKSPVSLPPVSSTNQLGEGVEFKDLMAEPGELADQEWFTHTELLNVDDQAPSKLDDGDDDTMKWTSQDEGDELIKLISQDDVFAWKDDSFLSQNEEDATLEEGMSNNPDFGRTDKTLFQ